VKSEPDGNPHAGLLDSQSDGFTLDRMNERTETIAGACCLFDAKTLRRVAIDRTHARSVAWNVALALLRLARHDRS
jgi:hypothetical protein